MSAPQKTIKGVTFSFGTIPAEAALDVEVSIARLFGPLLVSMASGTGLDEAAQMRAITEGLQTLSAQPNHVALKAELKDMIATVLRSVAAGGNASLDMTFFNGKPKLMWEVIIEAVRVNFADFFPANPSPSPQPATPA